MQTELMMIVLGVPLLALAAAMLYARKQIRQCNIQLQEQHKQLHKLENDLRALSAGAVGVDQRIGRLEQRARRIRERQEQLEMRDNSRPYDQAIRMVHKGTNVEEIMAVCELSRGEAELIQMMHSMDKAS